MIAKIAEVNLKQTPQPIVVEANYSELLLVVHWEHIPLGLLKLSTKNGPHTFTETELQNKIVRAYSYNLWERALAGNLPNLSACLPETLPAISVVVCTRDRPDSLARCLQSLRQVDYPAFEVVVVDNCSQDDTVRQVVADSGFRYTRENTPGLNWARNRGLAEARHDLIAYTDDDTVVSTGWLRGIAWGFAEQDVMAVTGLVLPAELETPAQSDFEDYGGMNKGFQRFTKQLDTMESFDLFWASGWGVGANMAFRRSAFDRVGNFDVALDVGTPTNGGGDIEIFYRIVAFGLRLCYEPSALIYHVHRREDAALMRQIYNNGRSFAAYLMTIGRNEPQKRKAVLWFALRWWLLGWILQQLLTGVIKLDRKKTKLVWAEFLGCLSSVPAYRKAQKAARQLIEEC